MDTYKMIFRSCEDDKVTIWLVNTRTKQSTVKVINIPFNFEYDLPFIAYVINAEDPLYYVEVTSRIRHLLEITVAIQYGI